ncbi:MAG: cytidylate kinase-like family protein [Lachnospiraceae bacterium]|nr:cytidylate kinase-like family protein [Lachnospiraceae bacterium]
MEKQIIIALGREFGSGGHEAGEILAERYGIAFLDHVLLQKIAEEKHIDLKLLERYDEKPKNKLFSRTVAGYSSALEEHVANIQFDYIHQLADAGKSFVIVGRCAEYILRGNPVLLSVFVLGNKETKCARIMKKYDLTEEEAYKMMKRKDATRKNYHNYYCDGKWGDSRNYDLCINSSNLGVEGVVEIIDDLIRRRLERVDNQ